MTREELLKKYANVSDWFTHQLDIVESYPDLQTFYDDSFLESVYEDCPYDDDDMANEVIADVDAYAKEYFAKKEQEKHMDNKLVKVENQQVVTDSRNVAEHFDKQHKNVLRAIENLVAQNCATKNMFMEMTREYRGQDFRYYLMNRDGFSLLVMGFTGKEALEWKLKYIAAFNAMEKKLKETTEPKTEAEILFHASKLLVEQERRMKAIEEHADQQDAEIKGIRNVVALRPRNARNDVAKIIKDIAMSLGGDNETFRAMWNEAYDTLEERMHCDLHRRLLNQKKRLKALGKAKTEVGKVTKMAIIEADPRLMEGFLAVVKDMAIHYGITGGVA